MNLDALFQQIQFTEKQAREKRHFIQQAKCDINRSYEKINQIKEELSAAKVYLETKTDAKRKTAEEEDNFTREVTEFNNEYGLTSNRDLLIKKKVKTKIKDLENEAALLKNEMESMEHKNVQLNALQLQKDELKQDLFTLQSELRDLEKAIRDAERRTKDLEAEKVRVTEKPQTDPECLRLKKELEKCKDDSWESVCETLQTEIEILQMNLSQKKSAGK
ncbi:coiled-coil domain-containing protein 172 isoform X2 [Empidonax traillii]|uniref:coiled-coil domain-containing protein 172 isoform X2 n=1 Tax=Empidonax traillii TaxID=164674 RepID=UPI000FFCEE8A|nr:coiled-coil domain-containing protein 172 isoform X2 [Empidonax traillii]